MKDVTYCVPTHVEGRRDLFRWCKVGSNLFSCTSNNSSCTYATIQSPCNPGFVYNAQRTAWSFAPHLFFHSKTDALQLYTSWMDTLSILEMQ